MTLTGLMKSHNDADADSVGMTVKADGALLVCAAYTSLGAASSDKYGDVAIITGLLMSVTGTGKLLLRWLVKPMIGMRLKNGDETVSYLPVVE